VVLAALGKREGPEPELTDAERRQVRRQALGVWVKSIATGVVCTVVVGWVVRSQS
jgi:hypothetical protein